MNHHSKLCELLDRLSNWQLKPSDRQTIFDLESKIVSFDLAIQLKDKQIKTLSQNVSVSHQLIQSQGAQIARLTQSATNMGETLIKLQNQVKTGTTDTSAYDRIVDKVLTLENALKAETERQRQFEQESLKSDDPIDAILENLAALNADVEALKKAKRATTPRRSTVKAAKTAKAS